MDVSNPKTSNSITDKNLNPMIDLEGSKTPTAPIISKQIMNTSFSKRNTLNMSSLFINQNKLTTKVANLLLFIIFYKVQKWPFV